MRAVSRVAPASFGGIAVCVLLTTLASGLEAQAGKVREASTCTPIGVLAELRLPNPTLTLDTWRSASAFMQGAIVGILAPHSLEPFGTRHDAAGQVHRALGDSTIVCFKVRTIGRVADVAFLQLQADVLVAPGPIDMHELFAAIGPDGRTYLLGQDPHVEALGRNNPAMTQVSSVLTTYGLAGADPSGETERRQVTDLLTGAVPGDDIEYRYCLLNPHAVRAIVGTTYDTIATEIHFAPGGGIRSVRQREAALSECTGRAP